MHISLIIPAVVKASHENNGWKCVFLFFCFLWGCECDSNRVFQTEIYPAIDFVHPPSTMKDHNSICNLLANKRARPSGWVALKHYPNWPCWQSDISLTDRTASYHHQINQLCVIVTWNYTVSLRPVNQTSSGRRERLRNVCLWGLRGLSRAVA